MMTPGRWYGSRCVASVATIRRGVQALIKMMSPFSSDWTLAQHVEQHNLWTFYTHLAVQYGTACRPTSRPSLNWETVDCHFKSWIVDDKDSCYGEERPLPLPPMVGALLHQMVYEINLSTVRRLNYAAAFDEEIHRELRSPFLFFLEGAEFAVQPTNPMMIKKIFDGYSSLALVSCYPANVNRHTLRSFLVNRYSKEVAFELVNYLFGHKHFGYEPYFHDAATDWQAIHSKLRGVLECCLRQLGFRQLSWNK